MIPFMKTLSYTRMTAVLLLILGLVSQPVLAQIMPCFQQETGSVSAMEMPCHDMKGHGMETDKQDVSESSNACCDTECSCPMAGCASAAGILSSVTTSLPPSSHSILITAGNLHASPDPVSLYRPPIFA